MAVSSGARTPTPQGRDVEEDGDEIMRSSHRSPTCAAASCGSTMTDLSIRPSYPCSATATPICAAPPAGRASVKQHQQPVKLRSGIIQRQDSMNAYHVDDMTIVAAESAEQAAQLYEAETGEPCEPGEYPRQPTDSELDRPQLDRDEDERPGATTTIRSWLAAQAEPGFLCASAD
jgi:hypothetical protein